MIPAIVAIPVFRGRRKFHLDKGRSWSVVEHIVLTALAQQPRSAAQLSADGNLPRRLVIEVLVRLMRAGWVEFSQTKEGVTFRASPRGAVIANADDLPVPSKRIARWMPFVIDRITGTIYRSRELPVFEKHIVEQRAARERLVWLPPLSLEIQPEINAVVEALFESDERFVNVDPAGGRFAERYAVVSVRGSQVEGLPPHAPEELKKLVRAAALTAPPQPLGSQSPQYDEPSRPSNAQTQVPAIRQVLFETRDMIIGGAAHEEALVRVLDRARHRVLIHSTFIGADKFERWRPLFIAAANRGAVIDILWGEDDDKEEVNKTRQISAQIKQSLLKDGMDDRIRMHSFSTQSHAKLIVADDGGLDRYHAFVGSCNWLASGFVSFEVSVRLRDPSLVAEVLSQLAELARGSDGHWTDLAGSLTFLAREVGGRPAPGGRAASAALVRGPDHAAFVLRARDQAERSLYVTSHRLGAAGRPAIVIPAIAAVTERGIKATAYYCRLQREMRTKTAELAEAKELGLDLQPISEPRLHAKLLGWDDDHLVVTSQNWLSADPSENNPRREIGVYLQAPGLARYVIETFEKLRSVPP
jgi:cardiolipin synthase